MKYQLVEPLQSEAFKAALRHFDSGFYQQAALEFVNVIGREPGHRDAFYFLKLCERKLTPRANKKPTLVWQFEPGQAWETDWLRTLLAGQFTDEIVDLKWRHISDAMIVVDNRLVPEKTSYYREAFEKNAQVVLIHLSDEAFKDDQSAYKYCDGVIRCYWSERLANQANIAFLPLGYKAGFANHAPPKSATERKYVWSFAGDDKKLTRGPMLEAMSSIAGGHTHLTSGFGADDALPTHAYRALLDESVFVPCPGGWSNLETFRVYEALEAGCIPIVESRPRFDYFTTLLGPHPIPTVPDWGSGAELARKLKSANEIENIRQQCATWWAAYKPRLAASLAAFISNAMR